MATEFSTEPRLLEVRDLGRMRYAEALAIQRQVNQQVIDGQIEGVGALLLVEHEPVITVTPRPGVAEHLLAPPQKLKQLGVELCPTDRGGDITYHGPGQVVAYPILNLNKLKLNLGRYMRLLEQVAIDTATAFGVEAIRVDRCTGVWVGKKVKNEKGKVNGEMAKLCALGVRVRRGVSMHGLAMNVSTDLSHFELIVPCGLANRAVTSLTELLGERAPSMDEVKRELAVQFQAAVARRRHADSS